MKFVNCSKVYLLAMQAAFVYTIAQLTIDIVCIYLSVFFDNASHESECVFVYIELIYYSVQCSYTQPLEIGWLHP